MANQSQMLIKTPILTKAQVTKLENALQYQFSNIHLLQEALSHPSLKQYDVYHKNYERFELLGDSIITFVITEILLQNFPNYEEGRLAKIRANLICRDTLCIIANSINLADHLIMTKGEEVSGGRKNANNIENAMEALIAAIYIDSDIINTKAIVHHLWQDLLLSNDFDAFDSKSKLQEWSQQQGYGTPTYQLIKQEGPSHDSTFTVFVKIDQHEQIGIGTSIKFAEKNAAKELLIHLNKTNMIKSK